MKRPIPAVVASLAIGFLSGWIARSRGDAEGPAMSHGSADAARAGESASGGYRPAPARGGDREPGVDRTARHPHPEPHAGAPGRTGGAVEAPDEPPDRCRRSLAEAIDRATAQAARIAQVEEQLRLARAEIDALRSESRGEGDGDDATVAERRARAARDGELLVEFPHWSDQLRVADETADKYGLTAAEREALDRMYADFYARAMAELKRLYRDLTGDPTAGESATINGLLHDVINLAPPEICRTRMAALLQLLAAGAAIPEPAPGSPACEVAVYIIFSGVDRMDQEARRLGAAALAALWSSRSTFRFSEQPR